MSTYEHNDLIQSQFNSQAEAYLNSAVHAKGADLQKLAALVGQNTRARVLDMGCGGGHVSFQLAPHVAEMVAFDLSQSMLDVVRDESNRRGLNISTQQGSVESLPFPDDSFDYVVTRYSAHHWIDWQKAICECRRVLKPGGTFVVIDIISSDHPLLDSWLQTIEVIRDPSHVRDFSVSQWAHGLSMAGFNVVSGEQFPVFLEFKSWIERMQTPPEHIATLYSLMQLASNMVRDYFKMTDEGNFTLQSMYWVAQ
ncbi:MAG: putative methyltransferase YcgJ [Candidatus Celerinatantimonas neptuna]|nr:MAG: putative methyltransferase YcgJ [Candidatus Celerinatantimonas neptuna]